MNLLLHDINKIMHDVTMEIRKPTIKTKSKVKFTTLLTKNVGLQKKIVCKCYASSIQI